MAIENENALPELSLIDSTPEQAAENIKIAKNMQTTPSIVKEIKPQLSQITGGRFAASTEVTPEVKRSLGKSPEHASLMKNDIDKMSLLERHWNYAVETIRGVDRRRQLADYAIREIRGEKLSPKDLYAKRKLQFEQDQIEETRRLFDMSLAERTPAEIAGVVFDVSRAAIENWKSLGLGIGVGGLLGGALGFAVAGPPGALVLGRMGATRVGGLAATAVFAADTFKQTAADVWKELENVSAGVTRNGELMSVPLPEDERRAIASGVGVLSAVVGTFGGHFVASRIPFLQRFTNPKALAKFIASPEGSTLRGLAKRVAAAGIVEGSTEGFQEFLEIMGKNLGSTWDGSETKFTEALNNTLGTWERAVETASQVGEASFLGAVAAGTFTSAGMAVSPRVRVDEKQVGDDPEVNTELPPEPRLFENGGRPRSEFSDIVNPNLPSSVKGTQAVQLQIALLRMKDIADSTETKKLSPDELNDLQKRIFESSGLTSVYIDKDELQTWTTDEQKAAKARSILDPTGIAAAQANARIRVDINKFMQLVDEDPSIADIARPTADGMSAREYLALVQEQKQKAADILKSIPETEREAASRDTNVAIQQLEITQDNRKRALSEAQRMLKELGDNATPEQIITIEGDIQMLQNAIAQTDRHIEELRSGSVRARDEDIFGEEAYLEQPTFTEATAEMFSEKEREKYNAAQKEARQAVVKAINDAAEKDMNQRRDLFLTMRLFQERVDQIDAYLNNPYIDVVENFLNNNSIIGELTPEQQSRLARGLPVLAIDPKTLPPDSKSIRKIGC